jgi:hypothetical protein
MLAAALCMLELEPRGVEDLRLVAVVGPCSAPSLRFGPPECRLGGVAHFRIVVAAQLTPAPRHSNKRPQYLGSTAPIPQYAEAQKTRDANAPPPSPQSRSVGSLVSHHSIECCWMPPTASTAPTAEAALSRPTSSPPGGLSFQHFHLLHRPGLSWTLEREHRTAR